MRSVFRRPSTLLTLLLAAALGVTSCSNRFEADEVFIPSVAPPPPSGPPIGVDSQLDIPHPLFAGLGGLLAGDGFVRLDWEPATDDKTGQDQIGYAIFESTISGEYDFSTPKVITAPGATSIEFTNLINGQVLFYVVRAIDTDGNTDPNEAEWAATPNPVRYVRNDAAPGGDGLTPETAFNELATAFGSTGPFGPANVWVASGIHAFNAFTPVWPGRALYGGFSSSFDIATRDNVNNVIDENGEFAPANETTIRPALTSDFPILRAIQPFSASTVHNPTDLVVIDGVSLTSSAVVIGGQVEFPIPTGVLVDDVFARVTNCRFFDLASKGVDLQSDFLNGVRLDATVRGCTIQSVGGEGIFIDAHPDIVIDNNVIQNTGTEGIEAQWIHASGDSSARIEITRNRISNPGDEGIDLDFAEEDIFDPLDSAGARIRAFLRNNRVENAALQGIQLDLDFQNSDQLDVRIRVEDNEVRNSGLEGILIDGDARGSFRLARNDISANGGAGVRLTGSLGGPYARLLNNRIIGNGSGIEASGAIAIEVRHQILRANQGPAISVDRAVATVVNSLLMENGAVSNPTSITYSLVTDEPMPANAGTGVDPLDPQLSQHPRAYSFASGVGTGGTIPLPSTSGIFLGDTVEVRNDGVARSVVAIGANSIAVNPPTVVALGDLIALWGITDPKVGNAAVIEQEGLLVTSPAIDTGDALEKDRDGTPSDISPIGGDTPGNIGVETAIPLESAALEVVGVTPGPAELQSGSIWRLDFNRDLSPEIVDLISIQRGATDLTGDAIFTVGERDVTIDLSSVPFAAGDRVTLTLEPGEIVEGGTDPLGGLGGGGDDILPGGLGGGGEVLSQPSHVELPSRIGAAVTDLDPLGPELNGTVATAQPISETPALVDGALGALGDIDIYAIDLAAGQSLQAELGVRQIESLLVARITLLAADGTTTISQRTAVGPFFFDPVLPEYVASSAETIYIRVESAFAQIPMPTLDQAPVGAYQLILR